MVTASTVIWENFNFHTVTTVRKIDVGKNLCNVKLNFMVRRSGALGARANSRC